MLAFKPSDGSGSPRSAGPAKSGSNTSSALSGPAAAKAATMVSKPVISAQSTSSAKAVPVTVVAPTPAKSNVVVNSNDPDWQSWMKALPIRGLVQQLAFQTELQKWEETPKGIKAFILVGMPQLASTENINRLQEALSHYIGQSVKIVIETGKANQSIAAVEAKVKQEKQEDAEYSVANDDFVKTLQTEFGATVVPGSIRPIQ
jgi:DNA polymerase-3 subunit gamma/tau